MRTEGTITRKQAIELAGQRRQTEWYHLEDDLYMGIAWQALPGVIEILGFDEMTGDELLAMSLQMKYSP